MPIWPFRRGAASDEPSSDGDGSVAAPAPVAVTEAPPAPSLQRVVEPPAPAVPGWLSVAPLTPSLPPMPRVASAHFDEDLRSWQDPTVTLEPLSHRRSSAEPAGEIADMVTVTDWPSAPEPRASEDALPLELPAPRAASSVTTSTTVFAEPQSAVPEIAFSEPTSAASPTRAESPAPITENETSEEVAPQSAAAPVAQPASPTGLPVVELEPVLSTLPETVPAPVAAAPDEAFVDEPALTLAEPPAPASAGVDSSAAMQVTPPTTSAVQREALSSLAPPAPRDAAPAPTHEHAAAEPAAARDMASTEAIAARTAEAPLVGSTPSPSFRSLLEDPVGPAASEASALERLPLAEPPRPTMIEAPRSKTPAFELTAGRLLPAPEAAESSHEALLPAGDPTLAVSSSLIGDDAAGVAPTHVESPAEHLPVQPLAVDPLSVPEALPLVTAREETEQPLLGDRPLADGIEGAIAEGNASENAPPVELGLASPPRPVGRRGIGAPIDHLPETAKPLQPFPELSASQAAPAIQREALVSSSAATTPLPLAAPAERAGRTARDGMPTTDAPVAVEPLTAPSIAFEAADAEVMPTIGQPREDGFDFEALPPPSEEGEAADAPGSALAPVLPLRAVEDRPAAQPWEAETRETPAHWPWHTPAELIPAPVQRRELGGQTSAPRPPVGLGPQLSPARPSSATSPSAPQGDGGATRSRVVTPTFIDPGRSAPTVQPSGPDDFAPQSSMGGISDFATPVVSRSPMNAMASTLAPPSRPAVTEAALAATAVGRSPLPLSDGARAYSPPVSEEPAVQRLDASSLLSLVSFGGFGGSGGGSSSSSATQSTDGGSGSGGGGGISFSNPFSRMFSRDDDDEDTSTSSNGNGQGQEERSGWGFTNPFSRLFGGNEEERNPAPTEPAPTATTATDAEMTPAQVQSLASRLYPHISAKLKYELRRDRERAGMITGLHR